MLLSTISLLLAASVSLAAPVPSWKREVPQEHSHENILRPVNDLLKLNNPDEIVDAVFSLLGNAAASKGLGKIQDPDCLQQAVADQAFTNAKANNDIEGATLALIFRTLERNSGTVGGKSNLCTSIQAVNPEIAALQQHQDPAGEGAAELNKEIVLELARQIASIGGNPLDAIKSGTFPPGQLGDPTAKGNTCDDANDANGCINTLGLLVPDVSEAEIQAAVAGVANAAQQLVNNAVVINGNNVQAADCAAQTVTVVVAANQAQNTAVAQQNNEAQNNAQVQGGNLQTFAGALGGLPPAVNAGGRGFEVANNADFLNLSAALGRSCDVQHNACANAANAGADFEVAQCETQLGDCRAAIQA
jgi:hypothetical protein